MRFIPVIGLSFTVYFMFSSCTIRNRASEYAKEEILQTETEFAQMCRVEGIEKAFAHYAADDAVILLNGDSLVKGIENLRKHYARPSFKTATLDWKPDFVDASASGELGYTYGHYVYTKIDSTGKRQEYRGVFHTVWKKKDGQWKFVWD